MITRHYLPLGGRHITQRIVIVGSGSVLEQGVENLLGQEPDLQVSGVAYADDATFLEDVSHMRPDVILLNAAGPLDSMRIFELLKDHPGLASLRVIVVRPDDNTIEEYERRSLTATRSADLVAVIRRTKT